MGTEPCTQIPDCRHRTDLVTLSSLLLGHQKLGGAKWELSHGHRFWTADTEQTLSLSPELNVGLQKSGGTKSDLSQALSLSTDDMESISNLSSHLPLGLQISGGAKLELVTAFPAKHIFPSNKGTCGQPTATIPLQHVVEGRPGRSRPCLHPSLPVRCPSFG